MRERCPEAVLEEVEPPSLTFTVPTGASALSRLFGQLRGAGGAARERVLGDAVYARADLPTHGEQEQPAQERRERGAAGLRSWRAFVLTA